MITRLGRGALAPQVSILRPWNNDLKYEEMAEFAIQFVHPSKDETMVPKIVKQVRGGVIDVC